MTTLAKDLWSLVRGQQYVAPQDLAEAVEEEVQRPPLDFRTRLLIRDSVEALRHYWGPRRCQEWLAASPVRERIETICAENLGKPGFPYLREQIMEPTDPEDVRRMFREVGDLLRKPVHVNVGGSIALILTGYLARGTQDVDVVNELPPEIRGLGKPLEDVQRRYRIQLAHFQSHYLPAGWSGRVHSLGAFGKLYVYLVDVYDVVLSKLFSAREKDRDDLRVLLPLLERETLLRRLRDTCQDMFAAPDLRGKAERNWYILTGESLPS